MKLPVSWTTASIGELCNLINGMAFKPSDWSASGLPIIRIQNLNRPDAEFNYYDGKPAEKFVVEPGELLFAWSGTPGTSFGAHIWRGKRAILNQHIFRVRFEEGDIDKTFFKLAINAKLDELIGKAHGGVGLAHVTKGKFEQTEIVLPPLAEQRRIVAKLDAMFSRLSLARAELDRLSDLSSRLRSKAVRSAFQGNLSSDWREKNRIERRGRERDQTLPAGWHWATLGELSDIKSGITLGKKRPVNAVLINVPYLRVANVQRGALDLSVIKEIAVTRSEAESLYLQPGDILLNEGGDRDKLGRGWVWSGEISNCIHQNHVFRARLIDRSHSSKYISFYANEFGQDYFFEHGIQTTNLASISKFKLASLPIPVAPPEEQDEIVKLLENALARADRLEAEAARARALLDRLEAAILAKAFKGELVPQDPSDEPASMLLERIKAARAQELQSQPKRGRKAIAPRIPREKKTSMTKSRQDDEVKDKPYLADVIRKAGGSSTIEDLFKLADLSLTDFYKQLAWEVDHGHIIDDANQELKAA